MKRALKRFPFGLAIILAVLAVNDTGAAASGMSQRRAARLDAHLRAVLNEPAPDPQRVIIRVRPGNRPALRDNLVAHGDQILSEHESLDMLTAVIHGED